MPQVIYIAGITSSGKTTEATKLGKFLGLPVYKADDVYSMIARELKIEAAEQLVMPEAWKKHKNFGDLKAKYYKELLSQEKGDFIIEGFPLFFEQDRKLVKQAVGDHWSTFFYLKIPITRWQELSLKKFGHIPHEKAYHALNGYFEPLDHYYEIADPELLFVHHEKYQRNGFTDKKWELLQLNKHDIKGKHVVDMGCNAGWIGSNCLKLGARSVDGLDYNWRYAEEARMKGLDTYVIDLDNFETNTIYDVVICLATFHYVRDKEKLIEKIAKMTRKMFILEVPISSSTRKCLELHDTGKCEYYIPSFSLVHYWLTKYFGSYEYKKSIAPDNSSRLIFKAYARK